MRAQRWILEPSSTWLSKKLNESGREKKESRGEREKRVGEREKKESRGERERRVGEREKKESRGERKMRDSY